MTNTTATATTNTTATTETTHFAAIASNGLEPVVWGIGTTEDAARQEAEEWGGEDAPGDYVFVPITAAQRELIKAGDVSAASLGIELTKGQIAELA